MAEVTGNNQDNVIVGTSGDDIIDGNGGDDVVYAGDGNDTVYGGAGIDTVYGEGGNDVLYGGSASDFLSGGIGDDVLYGNGGNDTMLGDAGNDTLHGNSSSDTLEGGSDDDTVFGYSGSDTFIHDVASNIDSNNSTYDFYDGGQGQGDVLNLTVTSAVANLLNSSGALAAFAAMDKNLIFNFQAYVSYIDLQIVNIETINLIVVGNNAPTANADTNNIQEDNSVALTGNVLANDTDTDLGDVLTVSQVNALAGNVGTLVNGVYGTITILSDGSYTYNLDNSRSVVQELAEGQVVQEIFSYEVSDGNGGAATSTLTINITGTNDAPTANADSNDTQEDNSVALAGNVLANDSDPDANDALTVTQVSSIYGALDLVNGPFNNLAGAYGDLTIFADGSYSYSLNNSSLIVQSIPQGQIVYDVFTYDISDGHGGVATPTLTINITGTNDAPTANADANSTEEDNSAALTGNLLSNDTDPDSGDILTVSQVNGLVGNVGALVNGTYGTITILANGSYTYNLDNSRAVVQELEEDQVVQEVFNYQVSDGHGGFATSSLTISITGTSDAPIVIAVDDGQIFAIDENTGVFFGPQFLIANDTNVTSIYSVSGSSNIYLDSGFVVFDPVGTFEYLAEGETATFNFTYIGQDGAGNLSNSASASILVTGVNDLPFAVDDTVSILSTSAAFSIDVLANDVDFDLTDILSVPFFIYTSTNGATISRDPLDPNKLIYDPGALYQNLAAGATVTDAFIYFVMDDSGQGNFGEVIINITGANNAPVAVADTNSTQEDSAVVLTGNLLANDTDSDAGFVLTVSQVNSLVGNVGALVNGIYGTITILANGSYTYNLDNTRAVVQNLAQGQVVQETFSYQVSDGRGGFATSSLTIDITGLSEIPANAVPVAVAENLITDQNTRLTDNIITHANPAKDSDADGNPLTVTAITNVTTSGSSSLSKVDNAAGHLAGWNIMRGSTLLAVVAIDANGNISLTPTSEAKTLAVDQSFTISFDYTISDGRGGTATARDSITLNGLNDPVSVLQHTVANLFATETLSFSVKYSDIDLSDTHTVSSLSGSLLGTASVVSIDEVNNLINFSYTTNANLNFGGSLTLSDTINYTLSDNHGSSISDSIPVTIIQNGTGLNLIINGTPNSDTLIIPMAESRIDSVTINGLAGNDIVDLTNIYANVASSVDPTKTAYIFNGGDNNDTITIGDIIDDTISATTLYPITINGGAGIDTVKLAAPSTDLQGNSLNIDAVEILDLTGNGSQTLYLDQHSFFSMFGTTTQVLVDYQTGSTAYAINNVGTINGDSNDTVYLNLNGSSQGTFWRSSDGDGGFFPTKTGYTTYVEQIGTNPGAVVFIDSDVQVILASNL